ncbi:MAG: hypothetical protein MJ252_20635, partial [archaeon]|nr:hypothetical protein [archaeon]
MELENQLLSTPDKLNRSLSCMPEEILNELNIVDENKEKKENKKKEKKEQKEKKKESKKKREKKPIFETPKKHTVYTPDQESVELIDKSHKSSQPEDKKKLKALKIKKVKIAPGDKNQSTLLNFIKRSQSPSISGARSQDADRADEEHRCRYFAKKNGFLQKWQDHPELHRNLTFEFNQLDKPNGYELSSIPMDTEENKEKHLNEIFENLRVFLAPFKAISKEDHNLQEKYSRLIFIGGSRNPYKLLTAIPGVQLNPKRPFDMDDKLIDYAQGSDEELNEKDADDIQSNENESKEEEEEDPLMPGFVVPDGHLSEGEISGEGERNTAPEIEQKDSNIKQILGIRKNYPMPILIKFNKKDEFGKKEKKVLKEKLKMKLFKPFIRKNKNLVISESTSVSQSFPINVEIKHRKTKIDLHQEIFEHLEEIMKIVHGSFELKDKLITELSEKLSSIPKKALKSFLTEQCVRIASYQKNKNKKQWVVKEDVLNELGIDHSKALQLAQDRVKELEEKENKRLAELEKYGTLIGDSKQKEEKENNLDSPKINTLSSGNKKEEGEKETEKKKDKPKGRKKKEKNSIENNTLNFKTLTMSKFLKAIPDKKKEEEKKEEKKEEDKKDEKKEEDKKKNEPSMFIELEDKNNKEENNKSVENPEKKNESSMFIDLEEDNNNEENKKPAENPETKSEKKPLFTCISNEEKQKEELKSKESPKKRGRKKEEECGQSASKTEKKNEKKKEEKKVKNKEVKK